MINFKTALALFTSAVSAQTLPASFTSEIIVKWHNTDDGTGN
jgi:hypothetical protein